MKLWRPVKRMMKFNIVKGKQCTFKKKKGEKGYPLWGQKIEATRERIVRKYQVTAQEQPQKHNQKLESKRENIRYMLHYSIREYWLNCQAAGHFFTYHSECQNFVEVQNAKRCINERIGINWIGNLTYWLWISSSCVRRSFSRVLLQGLKCHGFCLDTVLKTNQYFFIIFALFFFSLPYPNDHSGQKEFKCFSDTSDVWTL